MDTAKTIDNEQFEIFFKLVKTEASDLCEEPSFF